MQQHHQQHHHHHEEEQEATAHHNGNMVAVQQTFSASPKAGPSRSKWDHKPMAPTLVAPHLHSWSETWHELRHHQVFSSFASMRDVVQAPRGEFRRVVERGALQAQLARAALPAKTATLVPQLGHVLVDAGYAGNLHWILSEQEAVPLADFYDDVPETFYYNAYHFGGYGSRSGGGWGGGERGGGRGAAEVDTAAAVAPAAGDWETDFFPDWEEDPSQDAASAAHHHHHHHHQHHSHHAHHDGGGFQQQDHHHGTILQSAQQHQHDSNAHFHSIPSPQHHHHQKQHHWSSSLHDHHSYPQQHHNPHNWYDDSGADGSSMTSCHCVFFTLRGFDVQDPETDTNQLAVDIANATPEFVPFAVGAGGTAVGGLMVHGGFWRVARALYDKVLEPHVLRHLEHNPHSKLVLTGHSAGGGAIVALLLLLTWEKGRDYVLQRVLRTYSYAAPQVVRVATPEEVEAHLATRRTRGNHAASSSPRPRSAATQHQSDPDTIPTFLMEDYEFHCPVLATMGLPPSLLYQYVQPWDTAVRLFTSIDPYYHAFEDVGADGLTLLASGSSRVVQRLLAQCLAKWSVWTNFRDLYRSCAAQNYHAAGIQQLLLPHRSTYFAQSTSHFATCWWCVPRVETVARLDASELLTVLFQTFPLDSDSHLHTTNMMRSFLHHVIPSYVQSFCAYTREAQQIRHRHHDDESYAHIASPWFGPANVPIENQRE